MVQPNTLVSLAMLHPDPKDEVRQAICGSTFSFNHDGLTQKEEQAMREFKAAARKCIEQLSEQTMESLSGITQRVFAGTLELDTRVRAHEDEMEVAHDFWCDAARASICSTKFNEAIDLSCSQWLGNGKWGWVMLSRRNKDKAKVVVKISDIKHGNIVAKEWRWGHAMGKGCPHIMKYVHIYLYGDNEKCMQNKLTSGYQNGTLKASVKRTSFPDNFLLMVLEFMNAGSVQDWIDEELLHANGMLVVLRSVAAALAYMHGNGVTHNDMKPENILVHREGSRMIVKLGDLGLAEKSDNRTSDITRYGMSALCMATYEKFGSRRFSPDSIQEYVDVFEGCGDGVDGDSGAALRMLPSLMRRVFAEKVTMAEISDMKCFRNIEWLDDGAYDQLQSKKKGSSKVEEFEDTGMTPAYIGTNQREASPQFRGKSFDAKVNDFMPAERRVNRRSTDATLSQPLSPFGASAEARRTEDVTRSTSAKDVVNNAKERRRSSIDSSDISLSNDGKDSEELDPHPIKNFFRRGSVR